MVFYLIAFPENYMRSYKIVGHIKGTLKDPAKIQKNLFSFGTVNVKKDKTMNEDISSYKAE